MSIIYKKMQSKETVNKSEVDKQNKLISLYNQLHGTDYDLNSVGIELVHKVEPSKYVYSSKPDTNFGWIARTGVPYSKRFTEKEKKELQGR